MKIRECPCHKDGKDCTKRFVNCHSVCEDYKDWRLELDADNEARQAANDKAYMNYIVPKIVERKKKKNEKCGN